MNQVSEQIKENNKRFFFAIEHTNKTSANDVEDMCELLELLTKKYNMKWCQAVWKDDTMSRLKKVEIENE